MTEQPKTMLEIIALHAKEWFAKRGTTLIVHIDKKQVGHTWIIYNTTIHVRFSLAGSFRIIYGTYWTSGTDYELADPEFPENMLQDVEEIARNEMYERNYL